MFTGIIEDLGTIEKKLKSKIFISTILKDIKIGSSIAVNGVCLTAGNIEKKGSCYILDMDVMPETWKLSNLGFCNVKDKVNIERALALGQRINGHLIQGHVEEAGKIISIKKKDNAKLISISCSKKSLENISLKGSIALDGISLTVMEKTNVFFTVSIIPETWEKTVLHTKKIGSYVNIETDFLTKKDNKNTKGNITRNLLEREGFI
ncbi:riboflavin synthase [bacterium]